jgi:hypothetical protein
MDDLVHRPVPAPPAGWFRLLSTALRSDPSITTYTSKQKVPEQNLTIYEMASRVAEVRTRVPSTINSQRLFIGKSKLDRASRAS